MAANVAASASMSFWDVEVLPDAFTVVINSYDPDMLDENALQANLKAVDVYIMSDIPLDAHVASTTKWVLSANPLIDPNVIRFRNLFETEQIRDLARRLAYPTTLLGQEADEASIHGGPGPLAWDVSKHFDPRQRDAYIVGFNSANYDMNIMACFFEQIETIATLPSPEARVRALRETPRILREYNDLLFDKFKNSMVDGLNKIVAAPASRAAANSYAPGYGASGGTNAGTFTVDMNSSRRTRKSALYYAAKRSGRHVDISRLSNAVAKTPLKELAGLLGYAIADFSDLSASVASAADPLAFLGQLVAYNVNDVVVTAGVFSHPDFKGPFDSRRNLLAEYMKELTGIEPGQSTADIRSRETVLSTERNFISRILRPDDGSTIADYPTPSFSYPSQNMCDRPDTPVEKPFNVVEKCAAYAESRIRPLGALGRTTADELASLFAFYRRVSASSVSEKSTTFSGLPYPERNNQNCILLVAKDEEGNAVHSGIYFTFGLGGGHGSEYDMQLLDARQAKTAIARYCIDEAKAACGGDPLVMRHARSIVTPSGLRISHTDVLKSGSTLAKAEWKSAEAPKDILRSYRKSASSAGSSYSWDVDKSLQKTSVCRVIHADAKSYYPTLLSNMGAFDTVDSRTGKLKTAYTDLYDLKEELGEQAGAKKRELARLAEQNRRNPGSVAQSVIDSLEADIAYLTVRRNSTKLLLNAASGAGAASFEEFTYIPNKIMSMRIIGQLLLWYIAQKVMLDVPGALPISINTDGIYFSVDDCDKELVEAALADIANSEEFNPLVEIEPEDMVLVSKDSNSRVEMETDSKIIGASSATVQSYRSPRPTKKPTKPWIIDRIIVEYMQHIAYHKGLFDPDPKQAIFRPLLPHLKVDIDEPMNLELARAIVDRFVATSPPFECLSAFSQRYKRSEASRRYPVWSQVPIVPVTPSDVESDPSGATMTPTPAQVVEANPRSRVYFVKDDCPHAKYLAYAAATTISATTRTARIRAGKTVGVLSDPRVDSILRAHGIDTIGPSPKTHHPEEWYDAKIVAIPNIPMDAPVMEMSGDLRANADAWWDGLSAWLDIESYIELAATSFSKTWMNTPKEKIAAMYPSILDQLETDGSDNDNDN